ncbi:MAG: hypothetical protein AB1730_28210 [Myxococcota bacterium]
MVQEVTIVNERTAELTLTAACVMCGGDVQLRVSPDGARTYCPTCHVIAKPKVFFSPHGFHLAEERPALA